MRRWIILFTALTLASTVVGASPVYADDAATPPVQGHTHDHGAAAAAPDTSPRAMGGHQMMRSMAAGDAELTRLLETMNAATGADKTAAMAALLTRLVQDRLASHSMMHDSPSPADGSCPMMKKEGGAQQHKHE